MNLNTNVVAVDIETNMMGLKDIDPFRQPILSISVSDGTNAYILTENFAQVVPLLNDNNITKIFHNGAFDAMFLNVQLGAHTVNIYDTLIVERLLNMGTDLPNGLDDVVARRFGVMLDKGIRKSFNGHTGPFTQAQLMYMEQDVLYLHRIREQQLKEAEERWNGNGACLPRVIRLENALVPVIVDMQVAGVAFDMELWQQYLAEVGPYLKNLENLIVGYIKDFTHTVTYHLKTRADRKAAAFYVNMEADDYEALLAAEKGLSVSEYLKLVRKEDTTLTRQEYKYVKPTPGGFELTVNLGSPKQLLELFADLGIKIESTAVAVLENLQDEYPIVSNLLDWRKWSKIQSWAYDQFVNPVTGRIHPQWNQTGTDSGRMSCSNPNMQQVSRPKEGQPNLRNLFPAREGYLLITSDLSQQEPRIAAQVSGDPAMIAACNTEDVYLEFGKTIFGHPIDKKSEERQMAKTGVLAAIYGAKPSKLAYVWKIQEAEAQDMYNKIKTAFPVAFRWGDRQLDMLVQRGYSTSRFGRTRRFPEVKQVASDKLWKYANIARNNPIQGTGADMLKMAMVYIWQEFKNRGIDARILMQVHDEIVVEAHESVAEEAKRIVVEKMELAGKQLLSDVLTIAEAKIDKHWSK